MRLLYVFLPLWTSVATMATRSKFLYTTSQKNKSESGSHMHTRKLTRVIGKYEMILGGGCVRGHLVSPWLMAKAGG